MRPNIVLERYDVKPPNSALQPPHSAVTPRAETRVAPAGGRLNASVDASAPAL